MSDPVRQAERRAAFERLKEMNDQGRLVTEKRKKFSPAVRRQVLQAQEGRCTACDEAIFGRYDVDHVIALELGGTNDVSNLVALHPECHKAKTADDVGRIAKCKRIEKRELEGAKPSQIRSRGFEKPRIKTRWPKRSLNSWKPGAA